jgi:hypothetical protein
VGGRCAFVWLYWHLFAGLIMLVALVDDATTMSWTDPHPHVLL